MRKNKLGVLAGVLLLTPLVAGIQNVYAEPLAGGTLDPLSIPKYVTPLVIPPVMNKDCKEFFKEDKPELGAVIGDCKEYSEKKYEIAVRQFKQQILPGGIWDTLADPDDDYANFPATTVWSYGPDDDPRPDSKALGGRVGVAPAANSQFNYPAYTIEAIRNKMTKINWINDLVDDPWNCGTKNERKGDCNFIKHILPIDRSLHWANPEQLACTDPGKVKDCRPANINGNLLSNPYKGPVPIVTHVHGAHVGPESDGYPEAWWLPDADNIPASYSTQGTLVNNYDKKTNLKPGVASFVYPNDQPTTTLWYHDHTLGMTRNNVYAGPAGFWLIREENGGETGTAAALPGPAPVAGEDLVTTNVTGRGNYRELPIVIQDRAFNNDGSLFYPANRAFFEGLGDGQKPDNAKAGLDIPFANDRSDIAPIWNPEAFFNVMVVNGVSWPSLDVEPDLYRFRLLNGCNSRFLNLAMVALDANGDVIDEVPFYQIGAEQSLMPNVVKVVRGARAALPGDGSNLALTAAPLPYDDVNGEENFAGLVMGLAERADVLVDFGALPAGTVKVRMINTAPDEPFGGFPAAFADPDTTGQVMEFNLVADTAVGEGFTAPENLALTLPDANDPANGPAIAGATRDLALLEEESQSVCWDVNGMTGAISYDPNSTPVGHDEPEVCRYNAGHGNAGQVATSVPAAPKAAVLGTNGSTGGVAQLWIDPIAQNPGLGATETWELWNWSADAHPIHLHLVKFKVVNRECADDAVCRQGTLGQVDPPELTEAGWKDTVIAYPGEVTRVNATFDLAGLYVWHCHIVEHEDNEMMVPFCVGDKAKASGCNAVP